METSTVACIEEYISRLTGESENHLRLRTIKVMTEVERRKDIRDPK